MNLFKIWERKHHHKKRNKIQHRSAGARVYGLLLSLKMEFQASLNICDNDETMRKNSNNNKKDDNDRSNFSWSWKIKLRKSEIKEKNIRHLMRYRKITGDQHQSRLLSKILLISRQNNPSDCDPPLKMTVANQHNKIKTKTLNNKIKHKKGKEINTKQNKISVSHYFSFAFRITTQFQQSLQCQQAFRINIGIFHTISQNIWWSEYCFN